VRILAVDPGGSRVGLAVGDSSTRLASPVSVIVCAGAAAGAERIADEVATHQAALVVIGLPTDADGRETPACARSHALASALAERGIDTCLQPEHLSTVEARRRARAAGRRRGEPVDDLAAQIILEEYLARTAGEADP
jgi:putative Holliday junction resolvase